ncbi:hypothetical protein Trydic_g7123 [Trypoxylus dichotomus]
MIICMAILPQNVISIEFFYVYVLQYIKAINLLLYARSSPTLVNRYDLAAPHLLVISAQVIGLIRTPKVFTVKHNG